jgi:hypothetical protein
VRQFVPGARRSGPLPQDAIQWSVREQPRGSITMPLLSFQRQRAEAEAAKSKPYSCYGDQVRAEALARQAEPPPLSGRYAIHPDEDTRHMHVRATGTVKVFTAGSTDKRKPGQRSVRVHGFSRSYFWTPEKRERAVQRQREYEKLRGATNGKPLASKQNRKHRVASKRGQ